MAIRRIANPEVEPVTVEEARDHLNFTSTDKDTLIGSYISAARAYVEGQLHIVIAESTWELTYDSFPAGAIALPSFPALSVESVKYDNAEGAEQTIDPADYYVDVSGTFGWVVPVSTWPATISAINAVRISFTAGWQNESSSPDPVSTVPQDLKQAVLLMVGFFFANRDGSNAINEPPPAVEALISHYRVPVLA